MPKLSKHMLHACIATAVLRSLAPAHGQIAAPPQTTQGTQRVNLQRENTVTELWYGVLKTPVREFRFVVELDRNPQDSAGKLLSLDEGNRTFTITKVRRADGQFSFQLPLTDAAYESTLNGQGTESVGTWTQRGQPLPLSLNRVVTVPKRDVSKLLTGTLNAIVQKIDVGFVELSSGKVYFNSISQNAGGFVATKEVSQEGNVIFRVPGVQGVFKGQYSDAQKTKLQGKWSQGLVTLDLTLTKQDNSPAVLTPKQTKTRRRPQTPKTPFPYTTEQVMIPTADTTVTLAGTLTLPAGKPKAGMILVSGSGPQDRDETIFDHKPFLVIADHFARQGIATLRYDDRGVAKSTGDFSQATSYDLANDAEAAFTFLSKRQELLDASLGICGHSEGGLLAPLIAARNARVNFVLLMAAPGVDGKQIILSQGPLLMRAQGVPEKQIAAQNRIQEIILTIIRDNAQPDAEAVADKIRTAFGEDQSDLSQLIETSQAAVAQQASPWLRTFLKLDPKQALAKLDCPVLAINGTKDLQVDAVLNLPAIRDTLLAAGNQNVEINVYPGLNHLFQECNTGLPTEYGIIEETFNLVPLRRMTSWTLEQAARR
ncbi:MAG: alpha/beta hydrolase [Rubripirellula sp.]